MTVFLSNRDGNGKTSEEGHYRLQTRAFKGFNLLADDLKVVQTSPLTLGVKVQVGDFRIESGSYAYTGWLDAEQAVSLPTADSANPRISSIVIYVDKNAATSAVPPNNPGVAKIIAVNGNPASVPVAPNNAAVQSAVGATNPFFIIANVTVPAAASTVTDANITDLRTRVAVQDDILSASNLKAIIGPIMYPVGSIYVNMSSSTNPATLLGFGTWTAIAGRFLVGIDGTQAEFNTIGATAGVKTHRHTGYGDGGDLRATIGSPAGDAARIGFQALDPINPNTGSGLGNFTYAVGGNQQSNTGVSHYTKVVGYTSTVTNLPPYQVVYMWRRTA